MALFGWDNAVDAAGVTLLASAALAGFGPEMLRVPIGAPSVAWQTPAGTLAASLTLTSPAPIAWRAICLARTNLTSGATIRVRVGAVEAFVEATPLLALAPDTPGWTAPAGLTVTRAHTPGTATQAAFDASGTLVEIGPNLPVINFDPVTLERLGWLQQPTRVQGVRNIRAEGAGAGVAPTNWSVGLTGAAGITATILGLVTVQGIPMLEVSLSGTATSAGSLAIAPETTTGITAATAQTWTAALWQQGPALAGLASAGIQIDELTSAGALVTGSLYAVAAPGAALARVNATRLLSGGGTVARVRPSWVGSIANGATLSGTIRIGLPTAEQGSFPTLPLLPPVGSPQATTRGVESFTMPLPGAASSGCFYVEQFILDTAQASASSVQGGAVQVRSVGSSANSINHRLLVTNTTRTLRDIVTTAGSTLVNINDNGVVNGQLRRDTVSWISARYLSWSNGTLIGQSATGTAPVVGEIFGQGGECSYYLRDIRSYPLLTDAQSLALSATGSSLLAPAYDSGTVPAGVAFGVGQALHVMPAAVSGLMARIDVSDPSNPDGFLNIPLAYAGPGQELMISMQSDSGLDVRRADTTTRGGQVLAVPLSRARGYQIAAASVPDSYGTWLDALEAAAAAGRNVLFVPRPGISRAPAESVYGLLAPGRRGFITLVGDYRSWSATISERL